MRLSCLQLFPMLRLQTASPAHPSRNSALRWHIIVTSHPSCMISRVVCMIITYLATGLFTEPNIRKDKSTRKQWQIYVRKLPILFPLQMMLHLLNVCTILTPTVFLFLEDHALHTTSVQGKTNRKRNNKLKHTDSRTQISRKNMVECHFYWIIQEILCLNT